MNKSTGILLNIIAVIAGVAVCVWLETSVFSGTGNAANVFGKMSSSSGLGESVVDMTIKTINVACPKMLDAETRLDSVSKSTADGGLVEYFTLINYEKSQLAGFESKVTGTLTENVRTNPGLSMLRESNVTFYFIYRDKNGVPISSIVVGPKDYK